MWFCLGSSFQTNCKWNNLAQATPSVVVGHSYQIKLNLRIICSQDDKQLEVSEVTLTLFWLLFSLLVSGGEKLRAHWERKRGLGLFDLFFGVFFNSSIFATTKEITFRIPTNPKVLRIKWQKVIFLLRRWFMTNTAGTRAKHKFVQFKRSASLLIVSPEIFTAEQIEAEIFTFNCFFQLSKTYSLRSVSLPP